MIMTSITKTNNIQTIVGSIPCSQFGFCHSHEHLFLADGQSAKVNAALRADDFDLSLSEARLYKAAGGNSIVDAQPLGCGRMSEYLVETSKQAGINIVASTGFHKLIFYPEDHWIHTINAETLSTIFINELTYGMYIDADKQFPSKRIPALAGVIKTASDIAGVDATYSRLFNAASFASISTGTPIMSHTEFGKGALEQIKLFIDHGVPSHSIIICHLDRNLDDISYLLEVAKTGVYMEFDTIGRFKYHSDEAEAELITEMVARGYEDKILIGLDSTRERMKSYGGSIGLDYIKVSFIPLLKRYGLSEKTINKFTVINPARAFSKYK